jgi:hypothetical protein
MGRLLRCGGWIIGGLLVLAALVSAAPAEAAAAPNLRIYGNQLIDGTGSGHVVQLRGVNRSGLEYACIQGGASSTARTRTGSTIRR